MQKTRTRAFNDMETHHPKQIHVMKNLTSPTFRIAVFCVFLSCHLFRGAAQDHPVTAEPIPQGFDFPADQAQLLHFRDQHDVASMRRHAWMVFAGITQKSIGGEAIWETWYSVPETFQAGPSPQGVRSIQRRFVKPRQLNANIGLEAQAAGQSIASFILFNEDTRSFIRKRQYNLAGVLDKVNADFPSDTPIGKRKIEDFPPTAMSVKTVWWVVKKSGMTGLPIWDGVPLAGHQPPMPLGAWQRAVAVDPSRTEIPANEVANIFVFGKAFSQSNVVPLAQFYSFAITDRELSGIQATAPNGQDAAVGDHAVLVCMHFTTKEIPDWVWGTVWWHDKPNDGPFAQEKPDQVKDVWRNYLMNTAFSADVPLEQDHSAHITFNPYLEARFNNGANSNCMACHQLARWRTLQFLPIVRGTLDPGDQIYAGTTKLDLLWSLAFEPQ